MYDGTMHRIIGLKAKLKLDHSLFHLETEVRTKIITLGADHTQDCVEDLGQANASSTEFIP